MRLVRLAGPDNCDDVVNCPGIFKTERGTLVIQGTVVVDAGVTVPEGEARVEVPLWLLLNAARRLGEGP